jgi:hypothetical protein
VASADRARPLREAHQAQGVSSEWSQTEAVLAEGWVVKDGGAGGGCEVVPDLALLLEPEDLACGAQLMAAGAADVWSGDMPDALLAQRLRDQLQLRSQQCVLARQVRYEAAVVECARLLVGRGSLAEHLQRVVEILRQACGVSRAEVFRNPHHPRLGLCVSQVHEACAPGIEPQIDNPQLQNQPLAAEAPSAMPSAPWRQGSPSWAWWPTCPSRSAPCSASRESSAC